MMTYVLTSSEMSGWSNDIFVSILPHAEGYLVALQHTVIFMTHAEMNERIKKAIKEKGKNA